MSYYLRKEEDYNLSPSEKVLRKDFLSTNNQMYLFENAKQLVDKNISYGRVVDEMYTTFTISLANNPPNVEYLNNVCINAIKKKFNMNSEATIRTRDRAFTRSNIPKSFLPRPSFTETHDSNEIMEFPLFRK